LIRISLKELNKEFKELQEQEQAMFVDENFLFNEHEIVGSEGVKQSKLLKKMYQFLDQ